MEKICIKIEEKIINILNKICNEPLIFLSEIDIHVLVSRELMKINVLNPDNKNNLSKTGLHLGWKNGKPSKGLYKTMLVHTEYGNNQKDYERSDIVILDKGTIGEIKNKKLKIDSSSKGYVEPAYIIEFGTENTNNRDHILRDYNKVSHSKKRGYLIHIHRAEDSGDTKNSINKLKEWFGEIVNQNTKSSKKNPEFGIKILAIYIKIYNKKKEKETKGKVLIFDNNKGKFRKVDLRDVKTRLKEILNSN